MATARTMSERALQRLGILSEEDSMTAAQGAAALAMLNDMLAGFPAEGIAYAHTDLTSLDTVVNVPDQMVRSAGLLLARELADHYGKVLSPQLVVQIVEAKQALQAFYNVTPPGLIDRGLLKARAGAFNFQRGE